MDNELFFVTIISSLGYIFKTGDDFSHFPDYLKAYLLNRWYKERNKMLIAEQQ